MRKQVSYLRKHFYLDILALFFLVLSFFIEPIVSAINGNFVFNPVTQVFEGYLKIITSPSILITDYVYIAGLGATFFNVATILIINILLIRLLKIEYTGPVYAGIVMIVGFSFFGKNIFNTLPIYLGIYLFSIFKKIPYKFFVLTILFSTGISPLVSNVIFGLGFEWYIGVPLGILCGVIAGFVLPALASHTIVFHEGYNLFNIGFALGIIAVCFYGVFKFFGLNFQLASNYDYSNSLIFYILLPVISAFSIVIGIIGDRRVINKYFRLIKTTGRLITDYAYEFGIDTVLFNQGLIGMILFIVCLVFKVPLNGVVFGSILSILGFAGAGVHIRNVLPVWVGAGITIFLGMVINKNYELTISSMMAFIFASGLAPIAGRYGIVFGLLAGGLHIMITPLTITFQGGIDLYNNGFSAGFVASIVNVMAEKVFHRGDRSGRKSKDM